MEKIENTDIQITNSHDYKINMIREIIKHTPRYIVILPFYFSQHDDTIYNHCPSISIILSDSFYINYHIQDHSTDDLFNKGYVSLMEGGKCLLMTLLEQNNLFTRIEKEGVYLCDSLSELPSHIEKLYNLFYQENFNVSADYHLTTSVNNIIKTLKIVYHEEINHLQKEQNTLIMHEKLELDLSISNPSQRVKNTKI